jgi:hypothetical protein
MCLITKMETARHSSLKVTLSVAVFIIASGLNRFSIHLVVLFLPHPSNFPSNINFTCYTKYCSYVFMYCLGVVMCMEYVEGLRNGKIIPKCHVNCPTSCDSEAACMHCCDCIIWGGADPKCDKGHCTCILYPPIIAN